MMLMLTAKLTKAALEDGMCETEIADVTILDHRSEAAGHYVEEVLIVTAEGTLCWAEFSDVEGVMLPSVKMFDPSGIPPLPHVQ